MELESNELILVTGGFWNSLRMFLQVKFVLLYSVFRTLHSLTQYAVSKLSTKPEKSDKINFDEAIDLYEALPIEELQYLSKLTDCESPQLDRNLVFTVD